MPLLERQLSFLHFTDCHFRKGLLQAEHWDSLLDLIPALLSPKPELILVTGDISDRNMPEGYELALNFFEKLLLTLSLSKDDLYIVPGNHDIDRSTASMIVSSADTIKDKLEAQSTRIALELPFSRYTEFIHKLGARGSVYSERNERPSRKDVQIIRLK